MICNRTHARHRMHEPGGWSPSSATGPASGGRTARTAAGCRPRRCPGRVLTRRTPRGCCASTPRRTARGGVCVNRQGLKVCMCAGGPDFRLQDAAWEVSRRTPPMQQEEHAAAGTVGVVCSFVAHPTPPQHSAAPPPAPHPPARRSCCSAAAPPRPPAGRTGRCPPAQTRSARAATRS